MPDPCCKVGRVIDARNLDRRAAEEAVDEYLQRRWRGRDGYSETGLRPLTDWFNKQVLKDEYVATGRSATETRIESEYDALRSGDEIRREEVVDDLETDSIDGEELTDDFISKSSLQRHFTGCLGVEKRTGGRSDRDWERERVEYVREVIGENVEGALRSLENKGELPGATDARTDVSVVLRCPECTTRVRFKTAEERGYICRDHLGTGSTERSDGSGPGDRSAPSENPSP